MRTIDGDIVGLDAGEDQCDRLIATIQNAMAIYTVRRRMYGNCYECVNARNCDDNQYCEA